MRTVLKTGVIGIIICCMAFMAGCGGSGSSSSTMLSGTAAAGAPIVGIVTVKDANGVIKTFPIEPDGKYSINVSGMQAPFKLKAEGKAGATTVTLYSAALASDVGGTINITPFTDLIIAQVAGDVAANYFQNADTSKLTPEKVAAETQRLRSALTDVLRAAGVSTTIDLLRTSFNADSSGLDKVMDLVKVSVDPTTCIAEIRNVIDDSAVTYDVTAPGTIDPVTSPSETKLTDVDQIRAQAKKFFDLFATALPSLEQVKGLNIYGTNFKQGGYSLDDFYSQVLSDPTVVGLKFVGTKIITLTDTTAKVNVSFLYQGEPHNFVWKYKKVNGEWKILGDQWIADCSIGAAADSYVVNGERLYSTGFNIDISNPMNEAAYALVKGPGLPPDGVRLENQLDSEYFVVTTAGGGSDWYPIEDAVIASAFAAKDSNVPYTFELYAADQTLLATYTSMLSKAPCTKAEITANAGKYFATLTTPSTAAALQAALLPLEDGNVHSTYFDWTIPDGMHTAEVTVHLQGASTGNDFSKSDVKLSASLPLQARDAAGNQFEVFWAEYRVHIRDAYGREFDNSITLAVP